MFDPMLGSVVISLRRETEKEELEAIGKFYDCEPIKLSKVFEDTGETRRLCQLSAAKVNGPAMVDSIIKYDIGSVMFVEKGEASVIVFDGKNTKEHELGVFVEAPVGQKRYLLCHETGKKWAIRG